MKTDSDVILITKELKEQVDLLLQWIDEINVALGGKVSLQNERLDKIAGYRAYVEDAKCDEGCVPMAEYDRVLGELEKQRELAIMNAGSYIREARKRQGLEQYIQRLETEALVAKDNLSE